ncbi:MAG: hypothetical protein ACK480_00310, partial [Planctomycetota bacterium]
MVVVQTAIEYEYRCTEYRFAEYEYEEIRCDPRTYVLPTIIPEEQKISSCLPSIQLLNGLGKDISIN